MNDRHYHHPILAEICRNAFELGVEPPLINGDSLKNGIKLILYPKTFKEKIRRLGKLPEKAGIKVKRWLCDSRGSYLRCLKDGWARR